MASTNKSFQDIFEQNRFNRDIAKKSKTWFEQQALLLSKKRITPAKILKNDPSALSTRVIPGHMYMFMYDALNKETLPYFDRFPLVFPFRADAEHMWGLNMHYLPYQLRVRLLDRLMQFRTNNNFDENTRIKYSWQLIAGLSKFKLAEPCVKQYRRDHIKSPFIKIDSADWFTALMLPVESFVGASKTKVWTESKKAATT